MKTLIKPIVLLLLVSNIAVAQQTNAEFPKLTGPYLGQRPPSDIPELFAPGIASTANHEHSRLCVSKDGREMYWIVIPVDPDFTSDHGNHFNVNKQNIFFATNRNGEWTKPGVLQLTKQLTPIALALRAENKLYFQVYDPQADPKESPRPAKLFVAEKDKDQWRNPQLAAGLLPEVKGKIAMTFCFADNGNLYFDSGGPDETGQWSWDVYIREFRDGGYLEAKLLENGINDGKVNWCLWVAPDESYLIWSSDRDGNYGDGDLYISFKNKNGGWRTPVNMGNKINTEGQERFPSVSADGKYLFFARHKDNVTYSDFYWVDAKIIEELKPKE
jgi:hypothetical protein